MHQNKTRSRFATKHGQPAYPIAIAANIPFERRHNPITGFLFLTQTLYGCVADPECFLSPDILLTHILLPWKGLHWRSRIAVKYIWLFHLSPRLPRHLERLIKSGIKFNKKLVITHGISSPRSIYFSFWESINGACGGWLKRLPFHSFLLSHSSIATLAVLRLASWPLLYSESRKPSSK